MDKIGDRTYALMVDRIAESEGKVDQLAGLNADLMLANKALRVENERLKAICFDHELNFGAAEEEINRLTARVAELEAERDRLRERIQAREVEVLRFYQRKEGK